MSWSKGAVVIRKHGDEEWSDTIARTLGIQGITGKERESLESEVAAMKQYIEQLEHDADVMKRRIKELERDNTFMKKHVTAEFRKKIMDAEMDYGYNWRCPKWLDAIVGTVQFGLSLIEHYIRKYVMLEEDNDA